MTSPIDRQGCNKTSPLIIRLTISITRTRLSCGRNRSAVTSRITSIVGSCITSSVASSVASSSRFTS